MVLVSFVAAMHSQLIIIFPVCSHMFTLLQEERMVLSLQKNIKGQASPLSLLDTDQIQMI